MDETAVRFKKELKRKSFHLLSSLYLLAYIILGRSPALKILVPILAIEGLIEISRFIFPGMNQKLVDLFGGIHREDETRKISGIFWTLAGSIVTFWLIPNQRIVWIAMCYLISVDTLSALIGTRFGKHRLKSGKSLEGSATFLLVSFLSGLCFVAPLPAVLGALFATVVEAVPVPGNDNFWIPVLSGLFLSLGFS